MRGAAVFEGTLRGVGASEPIRLDPGVMLELTARRQSGGGALRVIVETARGGLDEPAWVPIRGRILDLGADGLLAREDIKPGAAALARVAWRVIGAGYFTLRVFATGAPR
jgi:hypothetical protein